MRRALIAVVAGLWLLALGIVIDAQAQDPYKGWKIPKGAEAEKNPFPTNDGLLAAGKKVFTGKCARCHGPKGEGDGVDADPELKKDMDLTSADRAALNPEGVVFYKVWHGRQEPRMPAFEDQLTKDQAWAVVAYSQTLRQK